MKQTASKRKLATKGRAVASRTTAKAKGVRGDTAEAALATLLALLHADRWLFEASELAKKGNLSTEIDEFNRIRLEIVESLNRLQPRAYGAMNRRGYMGVGGF
jgi:hypothetical protein